MQSTTFLADTVRDPLAATEERWARLARRWHLLDDERRYHLSRLAEIKDELRSATSALLAAERAYARVRE